MLILSIQLHIFFLVELGKSASTTTASDFIEVLKYRGGRTQNCARAHPHSLELSSLAIVSSVRSMFSSARL